MFIRFLSACLIGGFLVACGPIPGLYADGYDPQKDPARAAAAQPQRNSDFEEYNEDYDDYDDEGDYGDEADNNAESHPEPPNYEAESNWSAAETIEAIEDEDGKLIIPVKEGLSYVIDPKSNTCFIDDGNDTQPIDCKEIGWDENTVIEH